MEVGSAAIRAVREPVAPFFVPVRLEDEARSGWHLGRRHDWADSGREEIVWLDVQEHGGECWLSVWRAGGGKPESPEDWTFSLRVGGVRSTPDETLDLIATRH